VRGGIFTTSTPSAANTARVERRGELVSRSRMRNRNGPIAQVHDQVEYLLGGPFAGRVRSDTEDVDPAGHHPHDTRTYRRRRAIVSICVKFAASSPDACARGNVRQRQPVAIGNSAARRSNTLTFSVGGRGGRELAEFVVGQCYFV
jgi:hypothetical protein